MAETIYMVRWNYFSDTERDRDYAERGYRGAPVADRISAASHEDAFAKWYHDVADDMPAWMQRHTHVEVFPWPIVGQPITGIQKFRVDQARMSEAVRVLIDHLRQQEATRQ